MEGTNCIATYPLSRSTRTNPRRPHRYRRSGKGLTHTRWDLLRKTAHQTLHRIYKDINQKQHPSIPQEKSQFLESFCPVSFISQIRIGMTVLFLLFFYKQRHDFKVPIDSKSSSGTCRLSSLDHLIMSNKSWSMPFWFITSNRPNLVIFFFCRSESIHNTMKGPHETNITC